MSGREQFWLNDPANLFKRWSRFVPTNDMTVPEALNAVVRFTIYSAILISLITQKSWYLLLIPAVMVVSAILVRMYPETTMFKEAFANSSRNEAVATPRASNPFMNVMFTDYVDNPDRAAAPSNINNNEVKASIDEAFSKTSDLFMDTSDKYGLMQSARQWVTQASTTIPNDLDGFQKFLNQDNVSRKEPSESYVVAKGSTTTPRGLL
jgi:hypothetical protein